MTDTTGTAMTDTTDFVPTDGEVAFKGALWELASEYAQSREDLMVALVELEEERIAHANVREMHADVRKMHANQGQTIHRLFRELDQGQDALDAAEADLESTKVAYRETLTKNEMLAEVADLLNGALSRSQEEVLEVTRALAGVEAINEELATAVVDLRADAALHETVRRTLNAEADEREREIEHLEECLRAANWECTQRDLDVLSVWTL